MMIFYFLDTSCLPFLNFLVDIRLFHLTFICESNLQAKDFLLITRDVHNVNIMGS